MRGEMFGWSLKAIESLSGLNSWVSIYVLELHDLSGMCIVI
jgi:hypothetical protein